MEAFIESEAAGSALVVVQPGFNHEYLSTPPEHFQVMQAATEAARWYTPVAAAAYMASKRGQPGKLHMQRPTQ